MGGCGCSSMEVLLRHPPELGDCRENKSAWQPQPAWAARLWLLALGPGGIGPAGSARSEVRKRPPSSSRRPDVPSAAAAKLRFLQLCARFVRYSSRGMSPPLQIKCPEPGCRQKGTWSGEARNSGGGEITQVT